MRILRRITYSTKTYFPTEKNTSNLLKKYQEYLNRLDKEQLAKQCKQIEPNRTNMTSPQQIKKNLLQKISSNRVLMYWKLNNIPISQKQFKQNQKQKQKQIIVKSSRLKTQSYYKHIPQRQLRYIETTERIFRNFNIFKTKLVNGYNYPLSYLTLMSQSKRNNLVTLTQKALKRCRQDVKQIAPVVKFVISLIDSQKQGENSTHLFGLQKICNILGLLELNNEQQIQEVSKLLYQLVQRYPKNNPHYRKVEDLKLNLFNQLMPYYEERIRKLGKISQSIEDVILIYYHISLFKGMSIKNQLANCWKDALIHSQFRAPDNKQLFFDAIMFLTNHRCYEYVPNVSRKYIAQIDNLYYLELLWTYLSNVETQLPIQLIPWIEQQIAMKVKDEILKPESLLRKRLYRDLIKKVFGQTWREKIKDDQQLTKLLQV